MPELEFFYLDIAKERNEFMGKTFDEGKELAKLKKIMADLPKEKRELAENLSQDAAFMVVELGKLRDYITENGWSETYKNGANQYGKKTSVEGQTYLQMQKSYAAVIKQLSDLLPNDKADQVNKAGESLKQFLTKGKPVETR